MPLVNSTDCQTLFIMPPSDLLRLNRGASLRVSLAGKK